MRRIATILTSLALGALLLTPVASAQGYYGPGTVPMNATATAFGFTPSSETMDPTGSVLITTASIDGTITGVPITGGLHIDEVRTRPVDSPTGSVEGQFTIADGFGSSISGDLSGDFTMGPNGTTANGQFIITGGTGRYAGTSGTGTFTETISGPDNPTITFTSPAISLTGVPGVAPAALPGPIPAASAMGLLGMPPNAPAAFATGLPPAVSGPGFNGLPPAASAAGATGLVPFPATAINNGLIPSASAAASSVPAAASSATVNNGLLPSPSTAGVNGLPPAVSSAAVNNGLVPSSVPPAVFPQGAVSGLAAPDPNGLIQAQVAAQQQQALAAAEAAARIAIQNTQPQIIAVPIPPSEFDPNGVYSTPARSSSSNFRQY